MERARARTFRPGGAMSMLRDHVIEEKKNGMG